jgi:hypothetical protein
MPNPRELTEAERRALWTEVRAEFPDDEMMQEVHFVRALHAAQLRDFTRRQRVEHFNGLLRQSAPPADSATRAE